MRNNNTLLRKGRKKRVRARERENLTRAAKKRESRSWSEEEATKR